MTYLHKLTPQSGNQFSNIGETLESPSVTVLLSKPGFLHFPDCQNWPEHLVTKWSFKTHRIQFYILIFFQITDNFSLHSMSLRGNRNSPEDQKKKKKKLMCRMSGVLSLKMWNTTCMVHWATGTHSQHWMCVELTKFRTPPPH